MNSQQLTINVVSLRIEQPIRPLYAWVADPNWRHVDRAGHEHYYEETPSVGGWHYPTLVKCGENEWCPECEEFHEITWLECRVCGEHVRPGSVEQVVQQVLPARYFIDDRPVTEAEYRAVFGQLPAAVRE